MTSEHGGLRLDPRLDGVIRDLGPEHWAAFALDAQFRLAWVSDELKAFLGEPDDRRLGIGEHALVAWQQPAWIGSLTPESGLELYRSVLRYMLFAGMPDEVLAALPAAARDVEPAAPPPLWSGSLDYVQGGMPPSRIEYVAISLRDPDGTLFGVAVLTNVGVRPTLLALLGRGDHSMYERMARIAEPGRHAAAILFADLQASAQLSRALPTAAYFRLIGELTAAFDSLVARHGGIVGKHAGDGWTAFVLAGEAGSPSGAVAAAIGVARALQSCAAELATELELPADLPLRVNAAVHWGPGVYLGQIAPGGRLEVTALGDEVNECARVEECARGGVVLVTKEAMELLDRTALEPLGIDAARLIYRPLVDMDGATDKTRRDAATLAVVAVTPSDD